MTVQAFRYSLDLYRESDGSLLGQAPVAPDWAPAEEAVRFQALRRGARPGAGPGGAAGTVSFTPVWHAGLGEPFVSGFRGSLRTAGEDEAGEDAGSEDAEGTVTSEFPSAYFKELAGLASSEIVSAGRLREGERFRYLVTAFPVEEPPGPAARARFAIEPAQPTLELKEWALADLLAQSSAGGKDAPAEGGGGADFPVFLPRRVLGEASSLAREAGARETGGVLIGHLHRDLSVPEVFAVVTALLPAARAKGELTSLTFTPEAWADVRALLELRRRGERFLGWMHSHPVRFWECSRCPIERRRDCALAVDFFSSHDAAVHRCVFQAAHSIALVVNLLDEEEETFSLFGWRQAMIQSRGFHVLSDDAPIHDEARIHREDDSARATTLACGAGAAGAALEGD